MNNNVVIYFTFIDRVRSVELLRKNRQPAGRRPQVPESKSKKGATHVDRISRMSNGILINRGVGGSIHIFTTQK